MGKLTNWRTKQKDFINRSPQPPFTWNYYFSISPRSLGHFLSIVILGFISLNAEYNGIRNLIKSTISSSSMRSQVDCICVRRAQLNAMCNESTWFLSTRPRPRFFTFWIEKVGCEDKSWIGHGSSTKSGSRDFHNIFFLSQSLRNPKNEINQLNIKKKVLKR